MIVLRKVNIVDKQTTDIIVVVRNDLDKQSRSQILVTSQTLFGRFKRASKVLAISWGIAILCILIPVLHFVLVPGGLLVGLFLFYRQISFHEMANGGTISCPKCNHEHQVVKEPFNWPKRENCPYCDAELILKKNK